MFRSKKTVLVCNVCFKNTYSFVSPHKISHSKLKLRKHCSTCNKHTLHQQTTY